MLICIYGYLFHDLFLLYETNLLEFHRENVTREEFNSETGPLRLSACEVAVFVLAHHQLVFKLNLLTTLRRIILHFEYIADVCLVFTGVSYGFRVMSYSLQILFLVTLYNYSHRHLTLFWVRFNTSRARSDWMITSSLPSMALVSPVENQSAYSHMAGTPVKGIDHSEQTLEHFKGKLSALINSVSCKRYDPDCQ